MCHVISLEKTSGRGVIKLFMLITTEHEIYPAHNIKMPTTIGILTIINRINTAPKSFEDRKIFIIQHSAFYELLKCYTELS